MKHLLVTNDFPPKIGGIQSLLWEWWRRLPPDRFAVLTSPHAGAAEFDAEQPFRVERTREPVLLPHPLMVRQVNDLARELRRRPGRARPGGAARLIGPSLELPYDLVLHGAEVTVPGRLPAASRRWRTCWAAPATSSPPAGTRPPRPSTRPGGRCRSRSCRPASTPSGSTRSTAAERPTPGAGIRHPGRRPAARRHLAARAPQGFDTAIRAVAAAARHTAAPTCCS